MWLDLPIILLYFVVIMVIGVRGRLKKDVGAEEYFLSSRSLDCLITPPARRANVIHSAVISSGWREFLTFIVSIVNLIKTMQKIRSLCILDAFIYFWDCLVNKVNGFGTVTPFV